VLGEIGEARGHDQQHHQHEHRGRDRPGLVAQHPGQQVHRGLIAGQLEDQEHPEHAHEQQVHRDQEAKIEGQDRDQVDQRQRGQHVAKPAEQRPSITAMLALDRGPQPDDVLDREQRDRDHLEAIEPAVPGGIDPGLGLEDDRNDVGRDQRDQGRRQQRSGWIVGPGVVENFMSSAAQFRHGESLAPGDRSHSAPARRAHGRAKRLPPLIRAPACAMGSGAARAASAPAEQGGRR
jgi:hypothetical protein